MVHENGGYMAGYHQMSVVDGIVWVESRRAMKPANCGSIVA